SRIIYDLENKMKHIRLTYDDVEVIIKEFFENNDFQIPGVKLNDFLSLFDEAVTRFTYTKYGLSLNEINNLYLVNSSLHDLVKNKIDTLLLPYCSKLVGCKYRYSEGCTMCGLCTIGNGYKLGKKYGLQTLTITSYEHLESVLGELDKIESKGYIGCCCEAFYAKHQMDFEKFKTPGVLINVESKTCYDLGLEKEAYLGRFDHQTHINVNLLGKILDIIF
ncbi:MAG: DUF116 domain-containing protein, partial [Candidatus Odinarchaeia archaeon]